MSDTFHVVCHDCEHECIWSTEVVAELDADAHREETGHDVEYARIDP